MDKVSWRLNRIAAYWPRSFPFSWAAQPGTWGHSLCWDRVLIPASSLQLIWTSCRRGYIIIWRSPTSCGRRQSRLSSDPLDRMHQLFTQVHFFLWQLGRGQYATPYRNDVLGALLNSIWWRGSSYRTFVSVEWFILKVIFIHTFYQLEFDRSSFLEWGFRRLGSQARTEITRYNVNYANLS